MLRSIDKQSRESMESVLKKKRKAMMGRICRRGRFLITGYIYEVCYTYIHTNF